MKKKRGVSYETWDKLVRSHASGGRLGGIAGQSAKTLRVMEIPEEKWETIFFHSICAKNTGPQLSYGRKMELLPALPSILALPDRYYGANRTPVHEVRSFILCNSKQFAEYTVVFRKYLTSKYLEIHL